jgi:hypothetical protein
MRATILTKHSGSCPQQDYSSTASAGARDLANPITSLGTHEYSTTGTVIFSDFVLLYSGHWTPLICLTLRSMRRAMSQTLFYELGTLKSFMIKEK